jgi:hypothetical protein
MLSLMPLPLTPEMVIAAHPTWTLAANRNQNLLGKTMIVANRSVEAVTALAAEGTARPSSPDRPGKHRTHQAVPARPTQRPDMTQVTPDRDPPIRPATTYRV